MNRALFAIALGLGISLMGCATDVEDPVPPAPAPEVQRNPPAQALSGQLPDPEQALLSGIQIDNGFSNVPAKQVHQGPLPSPE